MGGILNTAKIDKRAEVVCVGDFFHTHTNSEETIDKAWNRYLLTDVILAGNHDLLAHNDKIGSLVFMDRTAKSMTGRLDEGGNIPHVVYGKLGKPHVERHAFDDIVGYFIPHVYTQELFESSLDQAAEMLSTCKNVPEHTGEKYKPCVLFLHCNVDSGFAEGSDIALNLTTARAQALLDSGFHYIIVGHEHEPRDLLDGRLIVIGNTHPTQFGDIGPKRVLWYNAEKRGFDTEWVYLPETVSIKMDWKELAGYGDNVDTSRWQWLRLTGNAQASEVVELAKLVKKVWDRGENLFAVKVDVQIAALSLDNAASVSITDVPALVEKELQAFPDQLALWKEITGRAAA